jgi:hypothetical protein
MEIVSGRQCEVRDSKEGIVHVLNSTVEFFGGLENIQRRAKEHHGLHL